KSKYWYLSQFNLENRLKKSELMYLCNSSVMKKYKEANVVTHEYEDQRFIYFLKKGTLKLTRINEEGEELLTYLIPKGAIFGLAQLMTDNYAGNERIEAMENSIVCKVGINLFRELMEQNKNLNNYVLKLSGLKIKRLENHLENIIFKSAEKRIRIFIKQFVKEHGINKGSYYEANLFLNNNNIANLTNTNRQKVNQIMNSMKNEAIIDFDKKTIKWFKK
ncbi:MAG: CRP/FNR family cyclic AMP-dependent transcriptional regulator, partial [Patescibacteria group bacterium]